MMMRNTVMNLKMSPTILYMDSRSGPIVSENINMLMYRAKLRMTAIAIRYTPKKTGFNSSPLRWNSRPWSLFGKTREGVNGV